MKWIGQHIWDLISRFRSDVYLDDVTAGTVASTDFLGVDSEGKIVKTTGGSGGGISEEYLASRGENLITNYSGLLGTNYNFPNFTFDGAVANSSPGSFKFVGDDPNFNPDGSWSSSGALRSSEFMVVNANKKYKVSVDIKTLNGLGRYYMFTDCYDVDSLIITSNYHMYIANTLTTLALPVADGDTTVTLTDSSNFNNGGTAGVSTHLRSLIIWEYVNSFGYKYPPETYSRLNSGYETWQPGAINGNVITLRIPWNRGAYPAGTRLSNGSAGGTYKYNVFSGYHPLQTWSHKTGYMDGVDYSGGNVNSKFNPGTAKVKVGWLPNYRTHADTDANRSWVMEETAWVTNLFFGLDYSSSELIIDEDNMSSNLDDFVPSQQSVKAYVDTEVALKASLAGADFTGDVNTTASVKLHHGSLDYGRFYANSEGFNFDTEANRHVIFKKTGVETMRIDTSGNMGVGIASPTERLHVSGNAIISGDLAISGGDISLGGTGRIQGIDTVTDSTDAANKAYVDANGGGGGVNLIDNDTTTNFGSTSTITIQGNHVQTFQNGDNNVLVNIGSGISTANAFSITTDPIDTIEGTSTTFKIGTPHNSTGKNFYVGDWGGSSSKRATNNSSITFGPSNQAGNMENDSKIVVVVYGPGDNTNTGAGNMIASHVHTITTSDSSTANGITITSTNFILDGYGDKRKANITVAINPGIIASDWAATSGLTNHSGSQKFYRVSIAHKSNDLVDTYGSIFNSSEFFYDGSTVQPVGSDATISLDAGSTTKYLSNIKYYSGLDWTVSGSDIANISRDTRANNYDGIVKFTSGVSTDTDSQRYFSLSGNSTNDVNLDTNTYSTGWVLAADKYTKDTVVQGKLNYIFGSLATAGSGTNWVDDSARAWNTYDGNSSALSEHFREEEYRLPENTISTWNTNSISSSLPTWEALSVSGGMTEVGATINNAHDTSKDLLLQVQSSGSNFKLQHPHNFNGLAANPVQDKFTGTAPGTGNKKYYRWFRFSSAVDNFECDITGMTRANYGSDEGNGYINIKFSRPGVNNTWVPLDPDQGYQGGTAEVSCWNADNSEVSGPSYISDQNIFKCNFGEISQVFVMEITMNSSFSRNITSIILS